MTVKLEHAKYGSTRSVYPVYQTGFPGEKIPRVAVEEISELQKG